MIKSLINLFLIIALVFMVAGCSEVTSVETNSQKIALDDAEHVKMELQMGAGELHLAGGANTDTLIEAVFSYNQQALKPKVEYTVANKKGHLTIKNDEGTNISIRNIENTWDLKLNNDVKKELSVLLGAGEANLILGGLNITELDLKLGAGEATLDFTGKWKHDANVNIKGGVGETTLILPMDIGVKVQAIGGIGVINNNGLIKDGNYYMNEAYGASDVTINIDVKGGIGEINLEVE